MAKPKTSEWTDFIAESSLPKDPFTFTDASTYMLDGFQFDSPENAGVEDAARLPETRGLSGLPDGLVTTAEEEGLTFEEITGDEEGPDLGDMLSVEEGAIESPRDLKTGATADTALVDLAWLDPTQEQDPDRLPDNERRLDSGPDLEEAWGVDRRTDGISLVPNRDREAVKYRQDIRKGPKSGLPGSVDVKTAVMRAVRRSHYGDDLGDIRQELVDTLGPEAVRTRAAMEIVEDEHGLAGKVFVRAAAFPGIKQGKWVEKLRRVASGARYVITDDPAVASKLGMQMVDEVPWAEALEHYIPILKAAGHRIASAGSPKFRLRRALAVGPVVRAATQAPKPVVLPEIATASEAAAELRAASRDESPAATPEEKASERKRRAALVRIAKWVKAGALTADEARRIHGSGAAPHEMIDAAIGAIKSARATYEASAGMNALAAREAPRGVLNTKEIDGVVRWARRQMSEGMAGRDLDDLLRSRFSAPLLEAAEGSLTRARKAHEGLSGFLYVDADVYATPAGATGCENGALRHRANTIKHVLSMDRCASCVHANAEGFCRQYNKRLSSEVPTGDPAAYQRKSIRLADASDAEATAELFNPGEYGLRSASEDEIGFEDAPMAAPLEGMVFGGMAVEPKKE